MKVLKKRKASMKQELGFDVGKPCITASQCKRCLLKPTTSSATAISEVLFYTKQIQTKAMRVLNQNPISSMYLKMRLARRYKSPALF